MSVLERTGQFVHTHPRLEDLLHRLLWPLERATKGVIFGCQTCGQCVLHATGMVCPMTCPKDLRNGPCGGVRKDGSCEVDANLRCVWLTAHTRSQRFFWREKIHDLHPSADWSLAGSVSWINFITGRDRIQMGCVSEPHSALEVVTEHAC
jgi:hypothetical protein